MLGKEVSAYEILNAREKRANLQNEFIKKYGKPVLSFTLNIPGAIKINEDIEKIFFLGKNLIKIELKKNNINILEEYEILENTGYELLLALDENAKILKKIMINLEENEPLGRIFDIDIIDENAEKLSRNNYRKCFICDKQAQECARNQNHSIKELQEKVMSIIHQILKVDL